MARVDQIGELARKLPDKHGGLKLVTRRKFASAFLLAMLSLSSHSRAMDVIEAPPQTAYQRLVQCYGMGLAIWPKAAQELRTDDRRKRRTKESSGDNYNMTQDWESLKMLLGRLVPRGHDSFTDFLNNLDDSSRQDAAVNAGFNRPTDTRQDVTTWRGWCVATISACMVATEAGKGCAVGPPS